MKLWQPEIPQSIYYALINFSGTATIVVGVPNRRINVISCFLTTGVNTSLTWSSSTGSVDICGPSPITATGGYVLPFNAGGWFQTALNDSLILSSSPSSNVGGCMSYVLIGPPGT